MSGTREIFLERIDILRSGRSVSAFARFLGINQKTLDCIVKGDHKPSIPVIITICRACHCSADWLLGLSDTDKRDSSKSEASADSCEVTDIKQIRKVLGVSQSELADSLGITRQYMSLIESGHRKPTARIIEACQQLVDKVSKTAPKDAMESSIDRRLDSIQTDLQIIKKLLVKDSV